MSVLLVAGSGGHLAQLYSLSERLPVDGERVWVTEPTAQSKSLLAGQQVIHFPYIGPRQVGDVLRASFRAQRIVSGGEYTHIVSTGGAIALPFMLFKVDRKVSSHYIESATRVKDPSLTGRVIARSGRANMYTQYESWAGGQWSFGGSVFDGYVATPTAIEDTASLRPLRIVVTVGVNRHFGFRRLIERVLEIIPSDSDVVWQTGPTDVSGLAIDAREQMPWGDLFLAQKSADVVIAHAGTGSALCAIQAGKMPILVPRSHSRGEHVDEHQDELAESLERAGLALCRSAEDISLDDIRHVTQYHVELETSSRLFRLK